MGEYCNTHNTGIGGIIASVQIDINILHRRLLELG